MSARGVRAASVLETTGDRRRARVAREQDPSGDTHKDRSVTRPDTSSSAQSSRAPCCCGRERLQPHSRRVPHKQAASSTAYWAGELHNGGLAIQDDSGRRVGLRFKSVPQSELIWRPHCLDRNFKSNADGTGVLRDRSRVVALQPADTCPAKKNRATARRPSDVPCRPSHCPCNGALVTLVAGACRHRARSLAAAVSLRAASVGKGCAPGTSVAPARAGVCTPPPRQEEARATSSLRRSPWTLRGVSPAGRRAGCRRL